MNPLPPNLPRVRFATPADEEDLIGLVRDLHGESGLRDAADRPLSLSEGKVRSLIRSAVLRPQHGEGPPSAGEACVPLLPTEGHAAIGVIGAEGAIQGSVCLSIETTWYNEDRPVLLEIWNYVARPYRRSQNAKTLIAFSKAVASVLGLPLVMAVMSTERQAAKMRFYERNLGRPFGAVYLFNPSASQAASPSAG